MLYTVFKPKQSRTFLDALSLELRREVDEMRGETRKTSEKTGGVFTEDTLKDFFAEFDEVAARISPTGAKDIFEAGSSDSDGSCR